MLIPYDAIAYQERTSGVFTEAVMAGNIPLTTTNTWMARELLKFGLDNLIISWENPESVWQHIEKVFHCQETRCKLKKCRKAIAIFIISTISPISFLLVLLSKNCIYAKKN